LVLTVELIPEFRNEFTMRHINEELEQGRRVLIPLHRRSIAGSHFGAANTPSIALGPRPSFSVRRTWGRHDGDSEGARKM